MTSSFGSVEPKIVKDVSAVNPSPVYRFVPEVGFNTLNRVSYEPQLEIEVPSVVPFAPVAPVAYSAPVVRVGPSFYEPPVVPAGTYGVPN